MREWLRNRAALWLDLWIREEDPRGGSPTFYRPDPVVPGVKSRAAYLLPAFLIPSGMRIQGEK